MRIVIDMQGAQTESRFRGIGRYTMAFAQAVVRNRGEHEIILALNGLFPETIEPIRAAFDGLLPQENIRVWHAPGPVKEEQPGNDARREAAELMREAFLAGLQPDVIHISSLFEGYVDDAVTSIGRFDQVTPVSVTLHDLIPLLNPDHYLKPNLYYERYYQRKIKWLKNASLYLAISESARQEGKQHLSAPDDAFVNTLEAVEDHFQPQTISDETARHLRAKFGITRPFVLYTGGADERKNLPRLIEAYAALPAGLRETHQLLFAGRMPEGNIAQLKHLARSAGLKRDELIFTGYVTDEELVQLYNLCRLYVFPSWHEGFGLPALEAMACGAPVIGANTSSLPEVIGVEEALFDPFDVKAISAKLGQALEDEAFRQRLCAHGLKQAKIFSWDETAKRAIAAWETILNKAKQPMEFVSLSLSYKHLLPKLASLLTHSSKSEVINVSKCLAQNEIEMHFINFKFQHFILSFATGPFEDNRGIGRVASNYFEALSKEAVAIYKRIHSKKLNIPKIYFYTSIHWCPKQLPHNSVVMIHDVIPMVLEKYFPETSKTWREIYKPIALQASKIITISEVSARDINKYLEVPKEKIEVIHNGVSAIPVNYNSKIKLPSGKYFVYLGAYDNHKNLDIVIHAITNEKINNIHLVLIGSNTEALRVAIELKIERKVHCLGRLDDPDIGFVMTHATAVVFPSLYEGFGLPPLEAALLKVPSICSKRPPMTELLEGAAIFVETDDVQGWANAMYQIATDDELRVDIGEKAYKKASKYTWEKATKKLLTVLNQVNGIENVEF